MQPLLFLVLVFSTSLAASGQLLFRYGAKGNVEAVDFLNGAVIGGLFCYGLSTLLWIWALSRVPLVYVYPFTMLTFVLVYAGSAILLKEPLPMQMIMGIILILCGLFAIVRTSRMLG
jgi:drug/metabolite transporter (DMT)-like permease